MWYWYISGEEGDLLDSTQLAVTNRMIEFEDHVPVVNDLQLLNEILCRSDQFPYIFIYRNSKCIRETETKAQLLKTKIDTMLDELNRQKNVSKFEKHMKKIAIRNKKLLIMPSKYFNFDIFFKYSLK